MTAPFQYLNQPLTIGGVRFKHRILMGPMGDRMWTEEGIPGPALIDYHLARVRGGVALITIGASEVHPGYVNGRRAAFSRDETIPELRRVADALHAAGAPVFVQLHHGGPSANPPVSPSGVPCLTAVKPTLMESRALTTDEVREMRDHFIAGARRAQQAGFDGIELAGQAGYLLGQFFSPRLNLRDDDYGGDAQRRTRLALEIARGIRAQCGADFVIGYAISADELKPGGVSPADGVPFAVALQGAGIHYIDVRVGTHETFAISDRATAHNRFQSRAGIFEYSAQFKRALTIPVFCSVQGCYDPMLWEQALARGDADAVQLVKPLIVDPELPNKVLAGRFDDVRPCIFCMQCLDPAKASNTSGARTYCAVNPDAGEEWTNPLARAANRRHVLVIGGGPAGLEAARVAALRGHRVTLLEKDTELGGGLREIGACDSGDVYLRLRDWLKRACEQAGVTLNVGAAADAGSIRGLRPDVVVIAPGATRSTASGIKGSELPHVMTVHEAVRDPARVGRQVVIIGGGQEGVLIASTLARGTERFITIVEPSRVPQLGSGLAYLERTYASMTLLPQRGVEAIVGMTVAEIRKRDVLLTDDGDSQKLQADTVILALPDEPAADLAQTLQATGIETHIIGGASHSRNVDMAMHDAARVARAL
jgi:2,4-dienoyl-CoA reductase-like NADH-dependent reductase (Old Yellow Enzyme family)/NADPH-dependent 2,4-dienoyl-CoA reductase/sulfur reductase-like enzyme